MHDDVETARRALRLLDLTDLPDAGIEPATDALCAKALASEGPVAAVCVWPREIARARDLLRGSPVRIATVVNFPVGGEDVARTVAEVEAGLGDGAQEIDLVLPYRALLRGEPEAARAMVEAVRGVVDRGRTLKVILETGALGSPDTIAAASRLAIAAGADFLKTSTGKIAASATPEAAATMLEAIQAAGRAVGLKPSGGIRTLANARLYLDLADRVMGPDWAVRDTFRFGASGLYDALSAVIQGRREGRPREAAAY